MTKVMTRLVRVTVIPVCFCVHNLCTCVRMNASLSDSVAVADRSSCATASSLQNIMWSFGTALAMGFAIQLQQAVVRTKFGFSIKQRGAEFIFTRCGTLFYWINTMSVQGGLAAYL